MKPFRGLGHAKFDVMVTELETYLKVGYDEVQEDSGTVGHARV